MSPRSGRRRSREETAELIREAAVLLLQRDGLRGFSNSVRLDEALGVLLESDGIRLTHGSIYGRIWVDQQDFQLDVVATTVSRYHGIEIANAIVTAATEADRGTDVDRGTHVDRVSAIFEAAVATARASRMWNLWLGAQAAVVSTPSPEDDERMAAALAQVNQQVVSSLSAALEEITGRAHDGDHGHPAQVLLTQLAGATITGDTTASKTILAEMIVPRRLH